MNVITTTARRWRSVDCRLRAFCRVLWHLSSMADTPAGFVVSPRLTRRLTMAEAAQVLGWTDHKDPARTTLQRLHRFAKRLGEPVVWAGCGRGNKAWTTYAALRKAGLIDDQGTMADTVAAAMADTLARLDTAERTVRVLARTCAELTRRCEALEALPGRRRRKRRPENHKGRKRASERLPRALPVTSPVADVAA